MDDVSFVVSQHKDKENEFNRFIFEYPKQLVATGT